MPAGTVRATPTRGAVREIHQREVRFEPFHEWGKVFQLDEQPGHRKGPMSSVGRCGGGSPSSKSEATAAILLDRTVVCNGATVFRVAVARFAPRRRTSRDLARAAKVQPLHVGLHCGRFRDVRPPAGSGRFIPRVVRNR